MIFSGDSMKKYLFALVLFLAVLYGGSAFSRRSGLFSETGFIKSYGNEPFCYPVFVSGEKKYSIEADDETKRQLLSVQGKKILLTGRLLDDGKIQPEKFEIEK